MLPTLIRRDLLWKQKILIPAKNGMAMLLLTLLGYVVAIALFIFCITLLNADRPHRLFLGIPLLILSIAYWIAGIFLFCGLKVLKPQEALVLTLFGDYIGTLKGQGFYWVKPLLYRRQPRCRHPPEPERRREQQGEQRGCAVWQ